jgi:putative hydrolase of the HAD superfamily
MVAVAEADGANPLFELEVGRMTEADFLAKLGSALDAELGRPVEMHEFTATYWGALRVNQELVDYYRNLKAEGRRLALLTNNVREWEPRWRAMLPVDDIFELVVDSAFVGMRKPDPAIYALTLDRFGLSGEECVFVDDLPHNCDAAREAGMVAVLFESVPQAIAEVDAALGRG